MVKDPDITSDSQFQKIKNDFHQLEDSVKSIYFPNNEYDKLIDIESLAKYFVVYNLTHNMEINHPKSTYIYKDKNGKYFMGPIWDFDWAFDYEGTSVHFGSSQNPLFKKLPSNSTGYYFFTRFLDDPTFVALYKQTWNNFKKEKMSLLLNYIDDYAASITESQKNDYEVWKKGTTNFQYKIESLKAWLERRALYLDEYMNNL
jgi:spore coat protein CotH